MIDKIERDSAYGIRQSSIDVFFLFFSTVCVAALLTLDMPEQIGLNFVLLQVVARVCVPMFFLMAAHDFFMLYRCREDFFKQCCCLVKKGLILYLVFAGLYLLLYYLVPAWGVSGVSSYKWLFLRGLAVGEPPCSWMILSYLVGIVLVGCLIKLKQRPLLILIIAFLFHTVSIFTEIYFKAIMQLQSVAQVWGMYSRFFVTTRNGFFYGFFWCALGYFMTFHKGVTHKKLILIFGGLAGIALIVEHSIAFSMGWARDFKSSFMMIPVCFFIFFSISDSARFSGRFFNLQFLYNKQMFIAFMLLPVIALGARRMGIPAGASLFVLTLSVDLVSSFYLAVFSEKISFKRYKLHA